MEAIRGQGILHRSEVQHYHKSTLWTATFCLVLRTAVCCSIQAYIRVGYIELAFWSLLVVDDQYCDDLDRVYIYTYMLL
jgi:hypothetical protein